MSDPGEVLGSAGVGDPVAVGVGVPVARTVPAEPQPSGDRTEVLDRLAAGAVADPQAHTEVLARATTDPSAEGLPRPAPAALLSRRQAAEVGMYAGAGLVALAVGGAIARGWDGWDAAMRAASVGLTALALLTAGLFLRLPWTRRAGEERRRAVSAMLSLGAGLALVASGVGLGVGQAVPGATAGAHAVVGVLAMLAVCAIARSALAELGLLLATAWAAWVVVPPGPGTWAALVVLGAGWALAGLRWARARRTAAVAGSALALVASIGLAQGPWAWPARGGLAALVVVGLVTFLRGGANPWLALGAGSATALAASVAGAALGPALALLIGGAATMLVSGIALRSARRGG